MGEAGSNGSEPCTAIAGVLVWGLSAGMGADIGAVAVAVAITGAGAGAGADADADADAVTVGDTISSLSPSPNFSSGVLI